MGELVFMSKNMTLSYNYLSDMEQLFYHRYQIILYSVRVNNNVISNYKEVLFAHKLWYKAKEILEGRKLTLFQFLKMIEIAQIYFN